MMRNLSLVACVLALSLPIGSAFAEGEGAGNPYPFRDPGVTTAFGKMNRRMADTDPFQYRSPSQTVTSTDMSATAPQNGAEGSVQTANSLPHNAGQGTANYAHNQEMQQYWASRGKTATVKSQIAQPAGVIASGHNG